MPQKKKVIFDIDGTLAQSYDLDTDSYNETVSTYLKRSLEGFDWHKFKHVTDSGITSDLFEETFNRKPVLAELEEIETMFADNFNKMMNERGIVTPTKGALELIKALKKNPDVSIGVATGSWRKLAKIKLDTIGLSELYQYCLTSSEGMEREIILQKAIDQFPGDGEVWYFGDGIWDQRTCENLKINFIAVGDKLKESNLPYWVQDFENQQKIFSFLGIS